jgi:hypothetical protein
VSRILTLIALLLVLAMTLGGCAKPRDYGPVPAISPSVTILTNPERPTLSPPALPEGHVGPTGEFEAVALLPAVRVAGQPGALGQPGFAGFTEFLPSWNIDAPEGTGFRVEMRVGMERELPDSLRGELRDAPSHAAVFWSPWMYVGEWGAATPRGALAGDDVPPGAKDPPMGFELPWGAGVIETDFFVARAGSLFSAVQLRVRAIATRPGQTLTLLRAAYCFTDTRPEVTIADVGTLSPGNPALVDVPFRTQKTPDPKLSGRLCSPTSVAMVVSHFAAPVTTKQSADLAYDARFDIFGNWPRNVQAAHAMGVPGFLTRFSRWSEVEAVFREGRPIIASIRVAPGELRGSPYRETDGHLIVLTGIDAQGNITAADPAVGDEARGKLVYQREDLERVWLGRGGGTAYVLGR